MNLYRALKLININSFFCLLYLGCFLVLPLSKFIADFFLSIVSIYVLIKICNDKNFISLKKETFIFIFIIYIFLNSVFINNDLIYNLKSIALIRFPLFVLFPFFLDFKNILNFISKFVNIAKVLLAVFILDLFMQYMTGENLLGYKYDFTYQRTASFFNSELIAGSFLFYTFVIILSSSIFQKLNIINRLFLVLIYVGIYISGDRTPFIMINFFLFLITFCFYRNILKIKTFLIMPFVFLILVVSISHNFNDGAFTKYNSTLNEIKSDIRMRIFGENNIVKKFIFERWDYYSHYTKAYVIFKNNVIFGTGYKSFRVECDKKKYDKEYLTFTNDKNKNGCSSHPHNIYLEVLTDLGLTGFILLMASIYSFLSLKNKIFNKNLRIIFICFLIVFFFPFRPYGSLYTNIQLIFISTTFSYIFFIDKLMYNKKK